ncbi:hypothetical protein SAMN05880582_102251 [Rhizobium sp. RU20A]|uniref:glycosyltransferase n=1 Tax=Rhizobium sp. RU20A TaxID=1907412 RepID=UPI000955CEA1|nr:glycosyltransferase [Rhizobium sp. RU20A]SIQ59868.1 hypothetical protein SAMN05880582_102251 [Rhizobium sp. RU20A]
MKILHIAAHLGGGVGKAHAEVTACDRSDIRRHFALLEEPRDRRFAHAIVAAGATADVVADMAELARRAADADIVQVEWWNHPRLYAALCAAGLPAARFIFWSHISGLFAPFLPEGLTDAGSAFIATSPCSLPEGETLRRRAIGSGFGFALPQDRTPAVARNPRAVGYLGTVDFAKMHSRIFDAIDAASPRAGAFAVTFHGGVAPDGPVPLAQAAMRHPGRVQLAGHTPDPRAALERLGIFFYLLDPRHYGTAENALVEAMSLGVVPIVLANPCEQAIVEHGITGFVEPDIEAAARRLAWALDHPEALPPIGSAAMQAMAETRTAQRSATAFASLYDAVLADRPEVIDFAALLGASPAEWFLSTQGARRSAWPELAAAKPWARGGGESKGSLAHFRACFPEDPGLATL